MRDAKEVVRECRVAYTMQAAVEVIEQDRRAAKLEVLRELESECEKRARKAISDRVKNDGSNQAVTDEWCRGRNNEAASISSHIHDMIADLERESSGGGGGSVGG